MKRLELSSGDASHLLQRFKLIFRDGIDTAPLRLLLGEVIDEARVRAVGLSSDLSLFPCLPGAL